MVADRLPNLAVKVYVSRQPAVYVAVVIAYNLISEPRKLRTVTNKIVTVGGLRRLRNRRAVPWYADIIGRRGNNPKGR